MKSLAIKILLVLSSLVATLFLGEICLRCYFFINPRPVYIDQKLGWRATENYHRTGMLKDAAGKEYYAKVTTDIHGFRAFGNPQSERIKIFFIGDSFTQAIDVSDDKTYYGLLARKVENIEVFAYGAIGYGSLQEFMILDEFIDTIKPHIVIIQLCFNDFYDNYYPLETKTYSGDFTRPYMDAQGNIFYKNPSNWPYFISKLMPYSQLIRFITAKTKGFFGKIYDANALRNEIEREGAANEVFQQSSAVTGRIMNKIKNRGSDSVILAFPANDTGPYHAELEKLVLSGDFKLIDGIAEGVSAYEQKGVTTRAADKDHWNELGHKIAADKIYDYLIDHGYLQTPRSRALLPCNQRPFGEL